MTTAATLLVFGRGVLLAAGRYELTPDSAARVRAAVAYVRRHPGARVVFTGGWPEASQGAAPPPAGSREGDLMLLAARRAGLADLADLHAETRSRSTLENLLHVVEEGLLGAAPHSPARPLGLVSHGWHLPRVRHLAGKVLGLRGPALLDIPVSEPVPPAPGPERLLRLGSRLCFLGAAAPAALRRRERIAVAAARFARR
jgi:uncharacterized SAM-binding protein YcdF (DUF218 family)